MTQLKQKTFTTQKEVFIESDSVFVKVKNIREDIEYKIKFEELGFDTVKKRVKTANIPFYIFLLFDLLYVVLIIISVLGNEPFKHQLFWLFALLFFSIMTIAAYYNRNKDVIYLTGGQKVLELLATKPDSNTVNAFIEDIHNTMRLHFKNKFSRFDPDTPYEFRLNQLKWLKEIKALTDEEYSELINNTKTDKIIGFQRPALDD
ncbi:MAG: hypothetical protein IT249_11295 [Chitinophagaceae bacterium]|nr:hypothetical protein [Chitinophagaceae bacterium]